MLSSHSTPIISFVGFSGSGKTTLMTKVIKHFKQKGFRVATIKHDAHKFEIDHEGKDTWNYAHAGSDVILINSQEKLAMIEKLQNPITFDELIAKVVNVDIIFVEGYKHESPPKILLVRRESDLALFSQIKDVIAIATSLSLKEEKIPVFNLNDDIGIVEFIQSKILEEKNYGTRK